MGQFTRNYSFRSGQGRISVLARKHSKVESCKYLAGYSCSSVVIYSDASDIAAGACTVELKSKHFQKMWNSVEKVQSSIWREMKAIELALSSFKDQFQGKTIKWLTDIQNCVKNCKIR